MDVKENAKLTKKNQLHYDLSEHGDENCENYKGIKHMRRVTYLSKNMIEQRLRKDTLVTDKKIRFYVWEVNLGCNLFTMTCDRALSNGSTKFALDF